MHFIFWQETVFPNFSETSTCSMVGWPIHLRLSTGIRDFWGIFNPCSFYFSFRSFLSQASFFSINLCKKSTLLISYLLDLISATMFIVVVSDYLIVRQCSGYKRSLQRDDVNGSPNRGRNSSRSWNYTKRADCQIILGCCSWAFTIPVSCCWMQKTELNQSSPNCAITNQQFLLSFCYSCARISSCGWMGYRSLSTSQDS